LRAKTLQGGGRLRGRRPLRRGRSLRVENLRGGGRMRGAGSLRGCEAKV